MVCIGEVGVARRRPVSAMPEQFADQRKVLPRHDRLTGRRVSQVMQPEPAQLGIGANRPPAPCKAVGAPAFDVAREQERIGVAGAVAFRRGSRAAGRDRPIRKSLTLRAFPPVHATAGIGRKGTIGASGVRTKAATAGAVFDTASTCGA